MQLPVLKVTDELKRLTPRCALLKLLEKLYRHGAANFREPDVLIRLCPHLSIAECEAALLRLSTFKKSWRRKKPPEVIMIAAPPCYEGEAVHSLGLRLSCHPLYPYRLESRSVLRVTALGALSVEDMRVAERASIFATASWLGQLRFHTRGEYIRLLLVNCVAGSSTWCSGVVSPYSRPQPTDRPPSQWLDDTVADWFIGTTSVRSREWLVNNAGLPALPNFATCGRCGAGLRVTRLLHLPGHNVDARCDNCNAEDVYRLPDAIAAPTFTDSDTIPQPVAMPRKLQEAIVTYGGVPAPLDSSFVRDPAFARAREYREWAVSLLATEPAVTAGDKPRRRYLDLQER